MNVALQQRQLPEAGRKRASALWLRDLWQICARSPGLIFLRKMTDSGGGARITRPQNTLTAHHVPAVAAAWDDRSAAGTQQPKRSWLHPFLRETRPEARTTNMHNSPKLSTDCQAGELHASRCGAYPGQTLRKGRNPLGVHLALHARQQHCRQRTHLPSQIAVSHARRRHASRAGRTHSLLAFVPASPMSRTPPASDQSAAVASEGGNSARRYRWR